MAEGGFGAVDPPTIATVNGVATVAVGAYRHARRSDVDLAGLYAFMDKAIDEQFGPDQFVTAQMIRLDIGTGCLQWVNAGHPAALLIRGHRVVRVLENPGTLPVGFGGAEPVTFTLDLQRGDRVMFYTDGLVEEHHAGQEQFGEERMIDVIEHVSPTVRGVQHLARNLSHALKRERGGNTSDDATIFLVEWHGGTADHLATLEI